MVVNDDGSCAGEVVVLNVLEMENKAGREDGVRDKGLVIVDRLGGGVGGVSRGGCVD